MEPRLSMITLGVDDLERTKAFYQNVIGWVPEPTPPEIAFFDLGGVVFSLYPHHAMADDMGVHTSKNEMPAYQGFALAYNARSKEEVDAIFARLKEHGASIRKQPEDVFWGGYSGYFADPDGHMWEVAYNPHWRVREDGRILMKAND
ncbi:MAG: VOC family protein [Rhodospirillales bacterium]|nr:VOC family protein [Rhodospirillales bacterium]